MKIQKIFEKKNTKSQKKISNKKRAIFGANRTPYKKHQKNLNFRFFLF